MTYVWKHPPPNRFEHLFEDDSHTSLCGEIEYDGPAVEEYDPDNHKGKGATGLRCPSCRRVARTAIDAAG